MVTWIGGEAGPVRITGSAGIDAPEGRRFGSFVCTAEGSARRFTIPAAILAILPPGASGGITLSQMVARTGFSIPLAGGGAADASGFLVTYTSSGPLQAR
jgi:hypothetical protein